MKHAAEMLSPSPYHEHPIYSIESGTPTGTYHWAESKNHKPPLLKKITRTRFETLFHYHDGKPKQFGVVETIWKRGWRYVKGARKKAKQKRRG